MQLRNSKIIGDDKKSNLTAKIAAQFVLHKNATNAAERLVVVETIYSIVLSNIGYIMTDEFDPSGKLIRVIFKQTFMLESDINWGIGKKKAYNTDKIRQLFDKTRAAIVKKHPEIAKEI